MSFASIFVPNFMLQAVVRSAPGIGNRAMVLVNAAAPLRPVICLNRQASTRGIKPGTTKSEVEQFGGIAILERSRRQERIAHAALLDLAWSVSPRVEDTAPDNIVLDLTGLAYLFGSDENIIHRLAEGAERLGLETQIAAASNIEAAILASRAFPGITVIPGGEEAAMMGKAPVAALLFSAAAMSVSRENDATVSAAPDLTDVLETLNRWGIHTCASFAALPVLELSERLGQEGVRLQKLARGGAVRALILAQPVGYFEEEVELEDAVAELEPLSILLGQLLERMCSRIAARSLAAGGIDLRLQLEPSFEDRNIAGKPGAPATDLRGGEASDPRSVDNPPAGGRRLAAPAFPLVPARLGQAPPPHHGLGSDVFQLALRFPVPMSDPKTLLKLLTLRLQSASPSAPVVKITLAVDAAPPRTSQGDLFSAIFPDPEKVELTVARLASLVGDANIGSPELLDTHRPEGFRMRRFVPNPVSGDGGRPQRFSLGGRIQKEQVQADENPCHIASYREGRDFSPALESGLSLGASAPEAKWLQGLKVQPVAPAEAAGLKPHPSKVPCPDGGFRHLVPGSHARAPRSPCQGLEKELPTALRVFRPAPAARVETRNGCPIQIAFSGLCGRVIAASGPWRSSGDWWTEGSYDKDEWDLEIHSNLKTETGKQHGVYRVCYDCARKRWYVWGTFD